MRKLIIALLIGLLAGINVAISQVTTNPVVSGVFDPTRPGPIGATTPAAGYFTSGSFNAGGTAGNPAVTITGSNPNNVMDTINLRNTSTGTAAATRFTMGNNASAAGFTIKQYGSNHATLPNYVDIENEFTAPVRLSGNGGTNVVTISGAGNLQADGTLGATTGGSLNAAVCWKAAGVLGYCSSVVAAGGTCTCN